MEQEYQDITRPREVREEVKKLHEKTRGIGKRGMSKEERRRKEEKA